MKLEDLCTLVTDYLRPRMAGTTVTAEYPNTRRPHPLRESMVGVGLDEIRMEKGGFSQYLGVDMEENERFGQLVRITLRFDLLCPGETGGCHGLFSTLCQLLLLDEGPVRPQAMWCERMEYDRVSDGLRLTAKGEVQALFVKGGQDGAIREIEIIRRDG